MEEKKDFNDIKEKVLEIVKEHCPDIDIFKYLCCGDCEKCWKKYENKI